MSDQKQGGILIVTDYDPPGNHIVKIVEATRRNPPKPGTVNHVSIAHDDWCALLAGKGPCDCDPTVEILGQEQ